MKSKGIAIVALILPLNLVSFALVSSSNACVQPPPPPPATGGGAGGASGGRRGGHCPRDALKLGICAKVLNGPVNAVIGTPPTLPCCSVINGLLDLEAAICFCTAIKANILGIDLNIPIVLNLLINACGKAAPSDFTCA